MRIVLGSLVLLLLMLNVWQWWIAHPAAPAQAAAVRPRIEDAAAVQVETVTSTPLQSKLSLGGQVSLTEQGRADATAPLAGTIGELRVRVGQTVEAGAPVAVINSVYGQTPLQMMQRLEQDQAALLAAQNQAMQAQAALGQQQAAVAQAQTALSQARDNLVQAQAERTNAVTDLRRKKALFEGGVSSRADVDDARERWVKATALVEDMERVSAIARRGVAIADDNLRPLRENATLARRAASLAETNLERDRAVYARASVSGATVPSDLSAVQPGRGSDAAAAAPTFVVRAPVTGIVTAVPGSVGQTVQAGTVIASVADTRRVYVDASAYDADLSTIAVGDRATVSSTAAPGRTFHGTVRYVGPVMDQATRTAAVRVEIDNPRGQLRAGMYVSVDLSPARPRRALTVPAEAVLFDGEKHCVAVQRPDGKVERRVIEEGTRTRDRVEVTRGLRAGERVVTHGNLLVVPE